ncbi:aldehyde dehydrogenase [Mycolicibacterium setense]|uniref:aldehyde dehydrogenase family protein n=1 Tax=Mycolicibacterium setense TaxID=431269 RepID=UPI0007EB425B|nr:aldehyde dehydrogenase family protein [Mycolicibacterium setense]OBB17700.1 aldehyde dehydrogenase [Mycolicibacterium setense]
MTFTRDALYIGGRWVTPDSEQQDHILNPATGRSIGTAPVGSVKTAELAIQAARTAFDDGPWTKLTPRQRGRYITDFANALDRHRDRFADLTTAEIGSPRSTSDGMHVQTSIDICEQIADRTLPAFPFIEPVNPHIGKSMTGLPQITQGVVRREPVGVASLITPFNGPLVLSMYKLIPALAAGCTVVLKPSPYTPLAVLAIGDLVDEIGLPPGVVNIITGDVDVSVEMTTHPAIDLVSFTGSDAVGRKVMAQAAGTVKRVVLELGGKSANIVFPDADLDRVALEVVGNMTFNCGQGCLLLTRTIVHESVHDEVVRRVVELLKDVKVGDPTDPETVMGPVIRDRERHRIEEMVDAGLAEGATLAFGGGRPSGLADGFFLNPALFTEVDNSMSVAQREIFGPVGVVISFKNENDAVHIANDSPYGLNSGVFTSDIERAYRVASQIRSGTVNINSSFGAHPDAPFGGFKQSGFGRERGVYGVDEFTETKFVSWNVGAV